MKFSVQGADRISATAGMPNSNVIASSAEADIQSRVLVAGQCRRGSK